MLLALAGIQFPLLAQKPVTQQVTPFSIQPGGAVPSVTPQGTSVTGSVGANSYSFSVRNSGTKSGVIYVSASCTGSGLSACSASPGSFSLAAGATRSVTVSYTGSAGASGQVGLNASNDDGSSSSYGWINVTVPAPTPTYNVAVTPDGASYAMEPGSTSYSFTVQNTGNNTASYALTPTCAGVATGCSAPASVTVAGNGGTATVVVSFSASTRGGTGTVSLGASYGGYSDNGSVNVSVNNSYGVSVTPDGGSQQVTPGTTATDLIFTVTNTGSSTVTYNFTATCGQAFSGGCSSVYPTSATVAPGGNVAVDVTANPSQLGTSFGVTLTATDGTHGSEDTGTMTVTTATYTVAVAPDGDPAWAEPNTPSSTTFWVHNSGTGTATYALSWNCSTDAFNGGAGAIGCSGPASVSVAPNSSQNVTVSYTTGEAGDSAKIQLTAWAAGTSDQGLVNLRIYDRSVAVTPDAQAVSMNAGSNSQVFTVRNIGNVFAVYSLSSACTGAATSCSPATGSLSLDAGVQATFTVGYSATAGGQNGQVTLSATASGFSDVGSINVHVNDTYFVSMLPHGGALSPLDGGSPGTTTITVTNAGTGSATYNLTPVCTNVGCPPSLTPVTLAGGASASVPINYTSGAPGTVGRIVIRAVDSSRPSVQDSGWVTTSVKSYFANVTPDDAIVTGVIGSTRTQIFTVADTGNAAATYTIAVTCTGAALNCAGPSTTAVGSHSAGSATVNYTVSNSSGSGVIKLKATAGTGSSVTVDSGWVNLTTITNPAMAGSAVLVSEVNPGTTIERSQCVIVAIVRDVADECGALRIVHPLPAVRTLGTARVPTLIYSSDHVQAAPLAVDVVLGDTVREPTTIKLDVIRRWPDGTREVVPTLSYPGSNWSTSRHRRLSVPAPAGGHGTGIVYDTVLVSAQYSDSLTPLAPQVAAEMAVVDRTSSPFGGGWWLAGLERLYTGQAGGAVLWVSGDGSTRKYTNTHALVGTDTVYLAAAFTAPDTLLHRADGLYRRQAGNGLFVEFDGTGLHKRTVNRHNYATVFEYSGNNLTAIMLPPWQGATPTHQYRFAYTSGLLDSVIAPSVSNKKRAVVLAHSGTLRGVQSIAEHLGDSTYTVQFGFQPNEEMKYAWRKDRRQVGTSFTNEASLPTIGRFATATGTGADSVIHSFRTASAVGANQTSQPIDSVYLRYDGPRPDSVGDVTKFWLNAFGAPLRIVNAVGQVTQLAHGDTRFPGLVTQSQANNGFVTQAVYDARGNLMTATQINPHNDGRNAITSYEWHSKWNMVTKIGQPEGDTLYIGYVDSTGDRQWQQDRRGVASRVTFDYYTDVARYGLLHTVTQPGRSTTSTSTAIETYDYDGRGNLKSVTSPLGRLHTFGSDTAGRVVADSIQVRTGPNPRWEVTSSEYDAADRVLHTSSNGTTDADTRDRVREAWSDFDREGNRVELRTGPWPSGTDKLRRRWTHDAFGRVLSEAVEKDSQRDQWLSDLTYYDAAGNDTGHVTRNGGTISKKFDALNRVVSQTTSAVTIAQELIGVAGDGTDGIGRSELQRPYPYYGDSTASGAYIIPAEVSTFAYDPATGALMDANNQYAKIHRTFYPNGQLHDETTRLRTWLGDTTDASFTHQGVVSTSYDRNGRRTTLQYPLVLSPGTTAATAQFAYDSTGALSSVTDLQNKQTQFQYDFRNAPVTTLFPYISNGTLTDKKSFDDDGLLSHWEAGYGGSTTNARNEDHYYDRVGKDSAIVNWITQTREVSWYDGLGQLSRSIVYQFDPNGQVQDLISSDTRYSTDVIGNLTGQKGTEGIWVNGGGTGSPDSTTRRFDPVSGRLVLTYANNITGDTLTTASRNQPNITRYDASGNVTWTGRYKYDNQQIQSEQRSYYGADNKLRATDARYWDGSSLAEGVTFEEYRYDALGRRIGVRTRQFCYNESQGNIPRIDCNVSTMRRTFWDGNAELGEVQVPGDNGVDLERDSIPLNLRDTSNSLSNIEPFFGRVAYVYAGALDQPLSVTRMGYQTLTQSGSTVTSMAVPTFTFYPLWTSHGVVDRVDHLGTTTACDPNSGADYPSGNPPGARPTRACVRYDLANNVLGPYSRITGPKGSWNGSLMDDKRDASGLMYRRNRYYDPASGRFTQEDPIGVAGGLNVYGFAGGDPVNHSDPFGLCPPKDRDVASCELIQSAANWAAKNGHNVLLNVIAGMDAAVTAVGEFTSIDGGGLGGPTAAAGRVVIGENMAERVIPYAKEIGADWYKATGKNPANWARNNLQWLRRQMKAGKEVVDLGEDATRTVRSDAYKAEKALLEKYQYPTTKP